MVVRSKSAVWTWRPLWRATPRLLEKSAWLRTTKISVIADLYRTTIGKILRTLLTPRHILPGISQSTLEWRGSTHISAK
ncbi:hypothetical protein VTO73DRAFT_8785 [Trametes versicolor]